ncbi:MAG: nucleoside transporter C-terminal domain-containing protein [Candidatus Latescibacterota bacterium]|nr:nucleoside transporter C-terminal domain-containing protein [Candidatus Latescibacterota bacterium]
MAILHGLFGYFLILILAWLCGRRSRLIPWPTIFFASITQIGLAILFLQTSASQPIFSIASKFTTLLQETSLKASESLLFGGITSEEFIADYGPIVAIQLASITIFVSSVSRILYHYRILPWIISAISRIIQKTSGISSAESVGVCANIFLGMTEAPLLIRPYIDKLTNSELFCIMTAGMATIAGAVMVIYASMLSGIYPEIAGHLFVASLISAPASIGIAKLMFPETELPETSKIKIKLPGRNSQNGLDAAARGAIEGATLVINILAMLIAFIGLIALINHCLGWLDQLIYKGGEKWSLELICGQLMRPIVWTMGVPWNETIIVGKLMGIKTILNEFIAYSKLATIMESSNPLSQRTFIITTYALCGFANFGSIAIIIGGIGSIAPKRRGDLARMGLQSLIGGTFATMLTGTVVGFFL